jgi:hypothetical protein
VKGSIQCHFGPGDLVHFYIIFLPILLVGGAGILAIGLVPLLVWAGILIAFFGFIEIRVMCSHCPHYAEEGPTLRCWANYGAPKLWKYRPGPMSRTEKVVFFAGLTAVFGYPVGFFPIAGAWFQLGLYLLVSAAFLLTLKRSLCSQCMNFACPLNGVPEPVRQAFWARNPVVGRAWGAEPENLGI